MLKHGVGEEAQEYVWDEWLDAWLTAKLQPKMDHMLATENSTLKTKVMELRRELEAMGDIHDNLRQQITALREANDGLRKENEMLRM